MLSQCWEYDNYLYLNVFNRIDPISLLRITLHVLRDSERSSEK